MNTSTPNTIDLPQSPSSPSDIAPSTNDELSIESLDEVQGGWSITVSVTVRIG